MSTILCVGRAVWDQIFFVDSLPLAPGKVSATNYKEAGGGPAATAAVAIARLGGNPLLWCKVGNDHTGSKITHELEAYGVDISEICIVPQAESALAAVMVDTTGAGDVFHGALALCLSRGNSFAEAARFASAASALKCTKPGGREGIPDENTLLDF